MFSSFLAAIAADLVVGVFVIAAVRYSQVRQERRVRAQYEDAVARAAHASQSYVEAVNHAVRAQRAASEQISSAIDRAARTVPSDGGVL
jgi:hypothetical protein